MCAVWLAAWTHGWAGGALPAHLLPLDLALVGAAALFAWRAHTRAILAPVALVFLHAGVRAGIVSAPSSTLQWGASAIVTGFALLLISLGLGWRTRRTDLGVEPSS
jgi:hypothetical protein